MSWQSINTVAEAVAFLRTIDVEVIGIWHGWILHGVGKDNDDFELTCDFNAELIDYSRSERDICLKLCNELGVETLTEVSERCACSSTKDEGTVKENPWTASSASGDDQAKEVRT
jgi:hypothetical protein